MKKRHLSIAQSLFRSSKRNQILLSLSNKSGNNEISARAMATSTSKTEMATMDEIVSVCKRRGLIFQSSEIYGGMAGFFDYGPLGVELKNNIKQKWWKDMVHYRDDIVGIDSAIVSSPKSLAASGHLEGFSDPMIDCKLSKKRYRADHVFYAKVETEDNIELGYVIAEQTSDEDKLKKDLLKKAKKLKKNKKYEGILLELDIKCILEVQPHELEKIPSPETGEIGALTKPREFNLMFKTSVGSMKETSDDAYLRPETAQGIFLNYKQVMNTSRMKVPFGIAQIGKAFRNEITPRNFIFRSREFEQMEIEYFISPDESTFKEAHQEWIQTSFDWLKSIGIDENMLGYDIHKDDGLAHYARACTDITFKYPFGEAELQGIAARGNYDLTKHQDHSGKSQEYRCENSKTKYVPHVIEPSIGVDRLMLAVLCSAYQTDVIAGEKRNVLRFHPSIAPIKVGVFPLLKNNIELVGKAKEIYKLLRKRCGNCIYDESGQIGRRYRRMDEVGTPYCVTIDFESLDDGTVTVRERDSTDQIRVTIDALADKINCFIENGFPLKS